ncbi:hypothetical protein IKQ38_00705 [Candidatus Saccharibacteria bacterium]|nr:hypothetical protein [Candidatus Saccharibacteria bacterium]
MATKKKYEFTGEQKHYDGITLNRIRALVNIPKYGVKAGDLGGWIQSENNLSQDGQCWVSGNAWVFAEGCVYGDALVSDNTWVYGYAQVSGNAVVRGDTWLSGYVNVSGYACLNGGVFTNGRLCG